MIPRSSPYRFLLKERNKLALEAGAKHAIVIVPEEAVTDASAIVGDVADVTTGPEWTGVRSRGTTGQHDFRN